MPDEAQQSELDRLRAFEQRMQTEGAAGFANGLEPWQAWREPGPSDANPAWESTQRGEITPPGKSLCEKLLSGMATVAVAALAVGIGGIYLSMEQADTSRIATNSIQPAPLTTTEETQAAGLVQPTLLGAPSVDRVADLSQPGAVIRETPPVMASRPTTLPGITPLAAPEPARPESVTAETGRTLARTDRGDTGSTGKSTRSDNADGPLAITENLPAPAAGTPARMALATPPAAAPATPAADVPQPAQDSEGIWVVNISSYTYESMARRKLAEFKKKGVVAEVFPATVRGKRIYRVRATGYDSYAEAKTWVSLLQDRLGVDSAWVSKR